MAKQQVTPREWLVHFDGLAMKNAQTYQETGVQRYDDAAFKYDSICDATRLENLQKTVEGYIEAVTYASDFVILCNEEGRLKGLPYNMTICGKDFVGTLIFIGTDGEDFCDIPITFKQYKRMFFGEGE